MCSVRLAANGSQFLPKVTYLPLKSRSELFVPGRTSVSSISHAAASMMAPLRPAGEGSALVRQAGLLHFKISATCLIAAYPYWIKAYAYWIRACWLF